MKMKVTELKEELKARREATSGPKAWLRRRLHAAQLWHDYTRNAGVWSHRERRGQGERRGVDDAASGDGR